MSSVVDIIIPVLLSAALLAIGGLYTRVSDLEKGTMAKELVDYRLEQLEDLEGCRNEIN